MSSIQFQKNPMEKVAEKVAVKVAKTVAIVIAGIFAVIIFALLFGFIFKYLWNVVISEVFGLPVITYWQAIGLFVMAKFLFGFGFGGNHQHNHDHGRKKPHEQQDDWCGPGSKDKELSGDDEMLQKYWEQEGKAAYEEFVKSQEGPQQGQPGQQEIE